jgi:hypothetical protein
MNASVMFSDAAWLKAERNRGYGRLPIPNRRDEEISALLRGWMELTPAERHEASASITDDQQTTLLAYSERMATYAVRVSDAAWVLLGLVALGVDGWRFDWRENTLLLCLHYDACARIGVSPERIFSEASEFLVPNVGSALRAFLKREEEDKSLAAMGYTSSADADGFRYERTW